MLLSEVKDPKVLAQKQSYIDYVAKELDKAGIKYERKGSTTLDVYNNVSRTRPIYVVRGQLGGCDLVDDSAARMATNDTLPGYDHDDVMSVKTVDTRNSYNKLLKVGAKDKTYTQDSSYKAVWNPTSQQHIFYRPKHYYTGVKKLIDAKETVYSPEKDMYLYGHNTFDRDEEDWVLTNIDVIKNRTCHKCRF